MGKVVAVVGMAGAGKSQAARVFSKQGYAVVRFGDITDDAVRAAGLPLNEASERPVREKLRKERGMAAYAELSLPRIEAARKKGSVVVDGLYSWEEYRFLKERYGDDFVVVAVWASPAKRYARLGARKTRPLTLGEAASRDYAEIEELNKGGPIVIADYVVINESSLVAFKRKLNKIIAGLK